MGSFAQAARRQGYLKDFGINLQSIAKMLNDRKLQREMMLRAQGDQRRKDRQTTAFNSAEDFYANNIKSTYNKAAEDQAITPFESAEINQGLYDFRKNMSKYPMVDKERLSSSDKAMSDLAKSLGVVVTPKETKYEDTPLGIRNAREAKAREDKIKQGYELEKITAKAKEDRATASFKNKLEGKDGANTKANKLPSLNEKDAQYITDLINPQTQKQTDAGFNYKLSEETITRNKDKAFNSLKYKLLGNSPKAMNWLKQNEKDDVGYNNPELLRIKAEQDYANGKISDQDAEYLVNYLQYYNQFYKR